MILEEDKDWEEIFGDEHESNPSMNPVDYYFQTGRADGMDFFTMVPKEYFDKMGCALSQGDVVPPSILPPKFDELSEAEYGYNGNAQQGRLVLISVGFIEKKMF